MHGNTVAVKRMHGKVSQKFENEMNIMGQLRHSNLVLVLGYVPNEPILVLEYLEKGKF